MKTALVTGAAGFTGRYVVKALAQRGFRVFGAGLGEPAFPDCIHCDLRDKRAAEAAVEYIAPDVVVHLAAMAFVAEGTPSDFYSVNVFGTLNLLEALANLAQAPSRVLIASSANIYGNSSSEELTEDTCPAPINHYAASKLAMEHMVKAGFGRLPIVITRPFNYTGPGQDERFVIPKIVGHYRRREAVIKLGDISVQRDFSDVEDVVEAYMRLLDRDVQSEVVNICSGRTVSLGEVLRCMDEIAGYKIQVEVDRSLLRTNDIARLVGSNKKLFSLTGFVPDRPIRETLRRMYDA